MMIEGSGSKAGSGSIPLTSGSGSRRPKNMWIRRIRIRNTVCKCVKLHVMIRYKLLRKIVFDKKDLYFFN
jgi:hypothetical protein